MGAGFLGRPLEPPGDPDDPSEAGGVREVGACLVVLHNEASSLSSSQSVVPHVTTPPSQSLQSVTNLCLHSSSKVVLRDSPRRSHDRASPCGTVQQREGEEQ